MDASPILLWILYLVSVAVSFCFPQYALVPGLLLLVLFYLDTRSREASVGWVVGAFFLAIFTVPIYLISLDEDGNLEPSVKSFILGVVVACLAMVGAVGLLGVIR